MRLDDIQGDTCAWCGKPFESNYFAAKILLPTV